MRLTSRYPLALLLSLVAALCPLPAARAADYFLTIGGGYSPQGNQVSLEKNVLFFQRLLSEQRSEGVPHDIFFADGESPERDLQFADPDAVPKANRLMARVLASEDKLDFKYRSHEVPGISGASDHGNIEKWFHEVGSQLKSGDRLIVYATAHGGKSEDKERPYNTRLLTYQSKPVTTQDLAVRLAALPEGVGVVLVMVQCCAGGFNHIIFNEGDAAKGLAPRDVCGFFATTHDRPAAGCTPDIREENYLEYSSFFWAAVGSKTRLGQPIPQPDYDGDGKVSFEEAHAYVLLISDAVDIPTKTSGAFLRHFSKTQDNSWPDLIHAEVPYDQLVEAASSVDRAVLDGLSDQLGLQGNERTAGAQALVEQLKKEGGQLDGEKEKATDRARQLKNEIAKDLRRRWPELANLVSATATELLTVQADAFIQAVEGHKG